MANVFKISALFKGFDQLTPTFSKLNKSSLTFQNRMKILGSQIVGTGKLFDSSFGSIAKGFIGASAAISIFNVGIKGAIVQGAEFQKTLTSAALKFNTSFVEGTSMFKKLKDAAELAGLKTEFTANQSAEALDFLALAGFKVEQAISALPGIINLATAAQVDLARSTEIATNSLGAFGLRSDDPEKLAVNLQRVSDVMLKTSNSFDTSLEQLFEAVKMSGTVGTKMGVTTEQFSAFAGVLGNSAIKGSMAGTQLRNVFLRLSAPAAAGAKELKKLGVNVKDLSRPSGFKDIIDIFSDLEKGLSKFSKPQQIGILKKIFETEGLTAATLLLEKGSTNLKKYQKDLENASGSTKKASDIIRNTTLGKFNQMISSFQNLRKEVFEKLRPSIDKTLEKLTNFMNIFSQDSGMKNFSGLIFKIAGAFLAVVTAIKLTTVAFRIFNLVASMNPLVKMISLFTIVGTLLYQAITDWDGFVAVIKSAAEWIKNLGIAIKDSLISMFEKLKPILGYIAEQFKQITPFVQDSKVFEKAGNFGDFRYQRAPFPSDVKNSLKTDNKDLLIPKISLTQQQQIGGQIDVNFNNAPKDITFNSASKDISLNVSNSGSF